MAKKTFDEQTVKQGKHLLWQGIVHKQPDSMRLLPIFRGRSARRYAFEQAIENGLPRYAPIYNTCGLDRCVAPAHTSRTDVNKNTRNEKLTSLVPA